MMKLHHFCIPYRATLVFAVAVIAILATSAANNMSQGFADDYNTRYITIHEGLPHNFVDDIHRDSKGFIWMALNGGGVARYDGHDFVTFGPSSSLRKIKSIFATTLSEDKFNRLWTVTDRGIDIIDMEKLSTLAEDDPIFAKLEQGDSPVDISKIDFATSDKNGNMWLHADTIIAKVSFNDDGSVNRIATLTHEPLNVSILKIRDIEGNGVLWTSINGKIMNIEDQGASIVLKPVADCLQLDPHTYVSDFIAKGDNVWISTDIGLYRYDPSANMVKRYAYDPADPHSLSQNFITDLDITSDKRLIATTLRGINIYNPINDNFERVGDMPQSDPRAVFNNNFINCVEVDSDRIWFGTEGGGLNKFVPRNIYITDIFHDPNRASSLSDNPVNSIYEDVDGTVWIGTVEGGLNRAHSDMKSFDHFTAENGAITHNSVSAITADRDGRLWVGTWGGGLNVIDRKNPSHRIETINATDDGSLPIGYIGALAYDSINNGIWIGSNLGLYFRDLNTGRITEPFKGAADGVPGTIGTAIDKKGHLWVGSLTGVYDIVLNERKPDGTFTYRHISHKLNDPKSKTADKISSIYMSSDGSMWFGTNGNGVYHRVTDENGEKFINYTTDEGMPSDIVNGILEDNDGYMWISTANGLARLNPDDGTFINYDRTDGLTNDQFYWNATCRLSDGRLLFGTVDGLIKLDGVVKKPKEPHYPVYFTSLSVANEPVYAGSKITPLDISSTKHITIHERDKSFTVGFSALDYDRDNAGHYNYRLVGFDDKWITLPVDRRYVTYTNLEPGVYKLQVRYVPEGSQPDESEISQLVITVKPYFYRTPWFIMIMILLVGASAWLFHYYRVKSLTNQRTLLQASVEERTSEIRQQKQLLEARAVALSEQNDMLKRNNEEITEQKTQLIDMSRRVQDLAMDRISFFTNITHEFRTPITLIIGPIQRALKLSYNPQVIEQLNYVERNARYLLNLVNQLMDFRKMESGKMEIVRTRGNFVKMANEILTPFQPLAAERNITLRSLFHIPQPELDFDGDALRKVITNLLSNAIKFTPDGGTVTFYAAMLQQSKNTPEPTLYLDITDSGNGIPESEINKVFDRFYQGKSQIKYPIPGSSGSGIGLYLCKSIVELFGGSIWARNNRNRGCSFRVLMPMSNVEEATNSPLPAPTAPASVPMVPVMQPSPGITILVVEDNNDMRRFICSVLRDKYNLLEASNGEEALSLLLANQVDFIISDLMMPVMDGLELSRRVKEDFAISHIPFLMLTAKTGQESRIESYRVGVDEYLLKPFDEELLLTRISNILENKRRHQSKFNIDMDVNELNIEDESRDKKFIDQVMEVVKNNYKNSYFEVGDFAEALGISRSLLNKKLQNLTGQSATKFMRNYRMSIARELILKNRKTRNMNVSEIAYEVGFNDSKYFTRCFTRQFNVTPSSMLNGDDT